MSTTFKEKETIQLLQKLVEIPSPSGYTREIMRFMSSILDDLQVSYQKTNKGALIATIEGQDTSRH